MNPTIIPAVVGAAAGSITTLIAVSALRRRPRIHARLVAEEADGLYYEGYEVEAIIGRRPIEVDEIGLLVLYGRRGRRRKLHVRGRPSRSLPAHLSDGQRVTTSFELDTLIDKLWSSVGDEQRQTSKVRAYVLASGREYRARVSQGVLKERLRTHTRHMLKWLG
jgi:hypothetical protein